MSLYKDLFNILDAAVSLECKVLTDDTDGTGVDLAGFDGAMAIAVVGIEGITLDSSNYFEFSLEESDTLGSGYTSVAAGDIIGASANAFGLCDVIADAPAIYALGYKGSKRFLRVHVEFTGTHGTGTPITAVIVRGGAHDAPTGVTVTP